MHYSRSVSEHVQLHDPVTKPSNPRRQGRYDETLLMEGKYKEWFWNGLSEQAQGFILRGRDLSQSIIKCDYCHTRKPRGAFNIGTITHDTRKCNKCSLTLPGGTLGDGTRFEDDLPTGWSEEAACAGMDPELFFPTNDEYIKPDAPWRSVCPDCPVHELCEEFARKSKSVGVFNGKLFKQSGNSRIVLTPEITKGRGRPKKKVE